MTYKLAEGGSNGGLNFLPGKQFSLRYETKNLFKPLPKSGVFGSQQLLCDNQSGDAIVH